MANIALHVDGAANRMALKAMLEADGHQVVTNDADLAIVDTPARAIAQAKERPALILATANGIADAVLAMRQGVYGYIFVPLQPGEAPLMVRRALEAQGTGLRGMPATAPETSLLENAELRHIQEVLRRCKNNQAKTARELGIGRNTLWRKLKKLRG